MVYLKREAAELYFELSRVFFYAERLSWAHYLDRMLALTSMCDISDPIYIKAKRLLLVEEWGDETVWVSNDDEFGEDSLEQDESNKEETKWGLIQDYDGYLQFTVRKKGLKDWIFHQCDADFHPSIPHGHFKGKNQPKLDAYLGWIYEGSRQRARLDRCLIVDLWNDEEFRVFATIAIDWYMTNFPNYNWRVNNPLNLPKRRY